MTSINQKIGSIIITYNPDITRLKKNINALMRQFQSLVIVDNGSKNIEDIVSVSKDNNSIKLIRLIENKGIAYAQNIGMEKYDAEHFSWVLMLDQDSIIPAKTFELMTRSEQFKQEDTGIIGMRFLETKSNEEFEQVQRIIASGNLINVLAWHNVGGFDNELFIDHVDYDFDFRLQLFGYKIWQVNSLQLKHDIGEVPYRKRYARLLGKLIGAYITEHSAMRQYYIYRNWIIMNKRYPEFLKNPNNLFLTKLRMILWSLSFKNPISKINSALKGIRDAQNYNVLEDDWFQQFKRNEEKWKKRT